MIKSNHVFHLKSIKYQNTRFHLLIKANLNSYYLNMKNKFRELLKFKPGNC